MGHISGKIASIEFESAAVVEDLDFKLDSTGSYIRRRFTLSKRVQCERSLRNTAFWLDNPPFYDARHGSGILSAVFLALAISSVGRRLLPEAIRLAHIGPRPRSIGAHLWNVLVEAPQAACDALTILNDRFLRKPRKPGFLLRNPSQKYALHYHAEQEPNPESRIVLKGGADSFGLPRVAIDLRFTDGDVRSVVDSHAVLDSTLRSRAVGNLEYWFTKDQLSSSVMAQASDGFHQVGTTRMGNDPRTSVVDVNLKVHGIGNLYIASSSVFPTSGQANSTFLAVALGLRLAHHLGSRAEGPRL
jgi:choline dehydrogenase-like flavoprotein